MKKTLFLILVLAGTLSLRAEENELFDTADQIAVDTVAPENAPEPAQEEKKVSKKEAQADEAELTDLLKEMAQDQTEEAEA